MSYCKPPESDLAQSRPGSIDSAVLPVIAVTTGCSGEEGTKPAASEPWTICPFCCYRSDSGLEIDSSFDM